MENLWILAQAAETPASSQITSEPVSEQTQTTTVAVDSNVPGTKTPAKGPFGDYGTLIFFALILVLFYFMIFRGPQKQKQQHQKLVESLKKNDKVRTIGGIIGTVVDIRGDEIVLKVDESNNTKIRVISSAIGKKLLEENN
jgi:preprotein translocase subunit YajC